MAKEKEFKPLFPSQYGSHSSMIDVEETKLLSPELVALRDEHGLYVTLRNRLDTGLADPNRYEVGRLQKLFARSKKEKE